MKGLKLIALTKLSPKLLAKNWISLQRQSSQKAAEMSVYHHWCKITNFSVFVF